MKNIKFNNSLKLLKLVTPISFNEIWGKSFIMTKINNQYFTKHHRVTVARVEKEIADLAKGNRLLTLPVDFFIKYWCKL